MNGREAVGFLFHLAPAAEGFLSKRQGSRRLIVDPHPLGYWRLRQILPV